MKKLRSCGHKSRRTSGGLFLTLMMMHTYVSRLGVNISGKSMGIDLMVFRVGHVPVIGVDFYVWFAKVIRDIIIKVINNFIYF